MKPKRGIHCGIHARIISKPSIAMDRLCSQLDRLEAQRRELQAKALELTAHCEDLAVEIRSLYERLKPSPETQSEPAHAADVREGTEVHGARRSA
jgi:chromosome segregation ATPase